MPGPLGWIAPADRDAAQNAAHAAAMATMPKFALGAADIPAGPLDIRLFKAWDHPDVIADCGGVTFNRFHQLTGSCVGAGGGNALFTLIALQRLLTDGATKAFIPWWPYDYGLSRSIAGFGGQGEGSLGSTFFKALIQDGVLDAADPKFPKFTQGDGLTLTSNLEMQWSNGNSPLVQQNVATGKQFPLGSGSELTDIVGVRAALANGYPVTWACDRYIGHGNAVSGANGAKYIMGRWDSNGGHQQSLHAVVDDPVLGPIYLALNNWPGSTYPTVPDQPVCSTYVLEKDVVAAFSYDSEVYALSHLNWFPAQPSVPDVLNWIP